MKLSIGCIVAAMSLVVGATEVAGKITGNMKDYLLVAGSGRTYLLRPDGTIAWEKKGCGNIHRVWLRGGNVWYSNGNLYSVDLVSGKVELKYKPCAKDGLYGFEFLKNGNYIVAENGTDDICERTLEGKDVIRFRGDPADEKGKINGGPHHHYRMIRKTPQGTYLVCCSGAHVVKEFDQTGKLVWSVKAPNLAFDCLRRTNGNTLVSHLNAVTEYAPDGSIVWRLACSDLPELKLSNLCGLIEKPNGNLIIGTYANGAKDGSKVTAFEVTRDKKVVWAFWPTKDRSMMTIEPISLHRWPVGAVSVSDDEATRQDALVKVAVVAKPAKARRVLVLSRAFGYCHNDAMTFGDRAIVRGGELTGAWKADVTHDVSRLADESFLAAYDAIVINNSTTIRAKGYPGMTETLTKFVKQGKGLCLIHSAVDSFYDDPIIADMNGGLFRGHPWMGGGMWSFRNEELDHPVNAALKGEGNPFKRSDEIYQQTGPAYSREKDRVLISMNLEDVPTAKAAKAWKGWLRDDGDFAVSWVRHYGEGRVFYTSFGHDRRAFLDAARVGHIFAGLQYCLGDLSCDDTPRK